MAILEKEKKALEDDLENV